MLAFLKKRRSFLVGAASVGVAHALLQSKVEKLRPKRKDTC